MHEIVHHTLIPLVISSIWERGKSRNFSTKSPSMKPAKTLVLCSVAKERNLNSTSQESWKGTGRMNANGSAKIPNYKNGIDGYTSCSMFPTLLMLFAIVCCNLDSRSNISMLNWQISPRSKKWTGKTQGKQCGSLTKLTYCPMDSSIQNRGWLKKGWRRARMVHHQRTYKEPPTNAC